MEFCTITPIEGLDRWGCAISKRHLVLAQMLYNPKYEAYYSARRNAGDFIILDNGAYENTRPIDNAAYFNMIKNLNPQVVVLPDILMSPWRKTTSAALKFLDQYADQLLEAGYKTQWMFVPQMSGNTFDDFYQSLETVLDDGRQGHHVKWIGLGRYLYTKCGYSTRGALAQYIRENYSEVRIHALGMGEGNINEMKYLKQEGVDSIDSSAPVWRGWCGSNLVGEADKQAWEVHGIPCSFHADKPIGSAVELIESNLEAIRVALRG